MTVQWEWAGLTFRSGPGIYREPVHIRPKSGVNSRTNTNSIGRAVHAVYLSLAGVTCLYLTNGIPADFFF